MQFPGFLQGHIYMKGVQYSTAEVILWQDHSYPKKVLTGEYTPDNYDQLNLEELHVQQKYSPTMGDIIPRLMTF